MLLKSTEILKEKKTIRINRNNIAYLYCNVV